MARTTTKQKTAPTVTVRQLLRSERTDIRRRQKQAELDARQIDRALEALSGSPARKRRRRRRKVAA